MSATTATVDNSIDDRVDEDIFACLNPADPVSFFLFAGAGSGKTGSLVKALARVRDAYGRGLWLRGQRIGVITYTNAACDEIKQRLEFDPLIEVSTIHSFAWSLIGGFHGDIREWLRNNLAEDIGELEDAQRKGKAGTKAAADRDRSIADKRRRLDQLDQIKNFVYSPTGDNRGRDALNHSEVISITSSFLKEKPALPLILLARYPILLIDESQDTNKYLMDALLSVQSRHESRFCLGLFGDTMQRIYADGKVDLPTGLPANWLRPAKQMNHRSPDRIVRLINKIRSAVDDTEQKCRTDKLEGTVRLFVVPADTNDKFAAEAVVAKRMAEITGDAGWSSEQADFKTLTLEHHMAARRMGFLDFFEPLYAVDRLRTGLLDGSLPGLRLFTQEVMPLVDAKSTGNEYAAAAVVRKLSPMLDKASLRAAGHDQPALLKKAREATDALMALWATGATPTLLNILRCVSSSGLFEIPESLRAIAGRTGDEQPSDESADGSEEKADEVTGAWERALATPFPQLVAYAKYITGQSPFDTHQGVKGLEFPRVMVIVDDDEARGFMFSYDKLFGTKGKSDTDIKNERDGKETSIERTRRLFYVTCSRAEESLAIVTYTNEAEKLRQHVIDEEWFVPDEVIVIE